ncbi:MAG: glycoside hydrolase family 16 protein [Oscillospiraceae bacterium]|nr:glycoside hydrolase family 16 protein [Oscillospiraceae bacterium]
MKFYKLLILTGLFLLSACGGKPPQTTEPVSPAAETEEIPEAYQTLVWSDEFSEFNPAKWRAMLGTGPEEGYPENWGNNELQYYKAENAFVRDGNLVIKINKENINGMQYTSARITTSGLFSFTYGRAEARIKLPSGTNGIWPAFWMLPDGNPGEWAYGTWAASGEIDIMENKSRLPGEISGAAHYGAVWPDNQHSSGGYRFPNGETVSDWHIYGLEWFPDKLIWTVDGVEYFRLENWHTSQNNKTLEQPKPFDKPFCFILNAAVGGNFDGGRKPDSSFTEAEMLVDWVRVYQ